MKLNKKVNIFSMLIFCLFGFALPLNAQQGTPCTSRSWPDADNVIDWVETTKPSEPGAKPKNCDIKHNNHDFGLFFKAFAEDNDFQKSATLRPLKLTSRYVDHITSQLFNLPNGFKGEYNIFPNQRQRACSNMEYKIKHDKKEPNSMTVTLFKKKSNSSYNYIFARDGCWFLVEIIEQMY